MDIKLNLNNLDFIIISDEIRGKFDYKTNSITRYLLTKGMTVNFPKPSLFERWAGRKQRSPKYYPNAFYPEGVLSDSYILEGDLEEGVFFIKDREIYTKPFLTLVMSGEKVGIISFNSLEDLEKYVEDKFSDLNLKTLKLHDNDKL